jgi:protein-tyrosine phosphatase
MRPGFGAGVSIPSQVRWVGYVERWAKHSKLYVENPLEIVEIQVWGLRDGVKVAVEGFVNEGKEIKIFHVFTKKERISMDHGSKYVAGDSDSDGIPVPRRGESIDTIATVRGEEAGGNSVILRPVNPVVVPTSDVNIDFERRNRAKYGLTMVTSVAHVWFNAFFEGNGPENGGKADKSGVYEIEWDKMDGIKGTSRKGTRAFEKMLVVWKIFDQAGVKDEIITEPAIGEDVPQTKAADWTGQTQGHDPSQEDDRGKDLGLRMESPVSADVSKASSIRSGFAPKDYENGEAETEPGPMRFAGIAEALKEISGESRSENGVAKSKTEPVASDSALSGLNKGFDTATHTTPNVKTSTDSSKEKLKQLTSKDAVKSLPIGKEPDELQSPKQNIIGHMELTAEPE